MKYIKKILGSALIGVGIGSVISLVMVYIFSNTYHPGVPSFLEKFSDVRDAVAVEFLVYALIGIISGLSGFLYQDIKENQIFIRTTIHYFIVIITVVTAGWYLHWGGINSISRVISVLIIATIIYFIIWGLEYLQIKKNINEINKHL